MSGAPVPQRAPGNGGGLRVQVLRSGSGGNAVFLEAAGTRLLVDAGLPLEVIVRALHPLNLTVEDIAAVLLTHEHDDHARGAGVLSRAAAIPVLANEGTLRAAAGILGSARTARFATGEEFAVGAFTVRPFLLSHDAVEPVGFALQAGGVQVVLAYDLGDLNGALRDYLPAADLILLEANYDPRLLGVSGYPWFLKNRILSATGHLSNEGAAQAALWAAQGGRPQTVFLLHLSEVNNLPPLARDVVRWAMDREGITTTSVRALRANAPGPVWASARGDAPAP